MHLGQILTSGPLGYQEWLQRLQVSLGMSIFISTPLPYSITPREENVNERPNSARLSLLLSLLTQRRPGMVAWWYDAELRPWGYPAKALRAVDRILPNIEHSQFKPALREYHGSMEYLIMLKDSVDDGVRPVDVPLYPFHGSTPSSARSA